MSAAGPNSTSSATSTQVGFFETVPWSNPGNATASDDSYATVALATGDESYALRCTGFGFTSSDVPPGATIDGIFVEVEVSQDGDAKQNTSPLVYGGSELSLPGTGLGDSTGNSNFTPDGTDTYWPLGGPIDTASASLTQAVVVDSSFGIDLYFGVGGGGVGSNVSVDHVRMTVYYTVGGTDSLTASNLSSALDIGTPKIGQTHSLTGSNLAATKAVMGTPALSQPHTLTATNLAASAAAMGTPALRQTHTLTATNLAASPAVMGTPALVHIHALTATTLTATSAVMGAPALGQSHILSASNLAATSAVMGTPAIVGPTPLTASNLTASNAVMGAPALVHIHALTGANLTATSAAMGAPALSQTHILSASSLVATSAAMDSPALAQKHALAATNLAASSAVMGSPILWSGSVLTVNNMAASAAVMGTPTLGQTHILTVGEMMVPAVMGHPVFALRPIGRSEGRGHYQNRGIRYTPGRYASTSSRVVRPVQTR